MADINSTLLRAAAPLDGPSRTEADPADRPRTCDLVHLVELLFFAYRDFTAEPDEILGQLGFGRAHHRVLHFVHRNPGLRVADLLDVLGITKQSLARVLKQLVDEGYVVQTRPETDRRERRLHLTEKGTALADRLLALQSRRIEAALRNAGPNAQGAARNFLLAMISDDARAQVSSLVTERPGRQRDRPQEDSP
ncbi:MAG: MarR family transcriptional regulator [Hyphomicrobiaceae bacterium]